MPRKAAGGGIGIIVIALIAMYFGIDPSMILNMGQTTTTSAPTSETGRVSTPADDRLQKQSRGYVTPDGFTHGTSAQRVDWFKRGIEPGDLARCNTFTSKSI